MKFLINIIFLVIIFLNPLFSQQLTVQASLSKPVYYLGEEVDVAIEHINNGADVVKAKDVGYTWGVIIKDNKDTLEYLSTIQKFAAPQHDYMPAESSYWVTDLTETFAKYRLFKTASMFYFQKGSYTVEIYSRLSQGGLNHIRLSFEVIEPEGDEKTVLLEAKKILSQKNSSKAAEALLRLHEKYPNSVYSPGFLNYLESYYCYFEKNKTKSSAFSIEMVEKYSWSAYAQNHLQTALRKQLTKKDQADYLITIGENCKNQAMKKRFEIERQKILQK